MIEAACLQNGDVYAVTRKKGKSRIALHTARKATLLYETGDKLNGLWVSPSGAIHAVGKRYHSNISRKFKTAKVPETGYSLWGRSDDEIYFGGLDGALVFDGNAWTTLGSLADDIVTDIRGDDQEVAFVGFGGEIARLKKGELKKVKTKEMLQGIHLAPEGVWGCESYGLFFGKDVGKLKSRATPPGGDELYGVGRAGDAIFVHGGIAIYKLAGKALERVRDNDDKALMVTNASYSTVMTSDGARVVAGGARSVLVSDGDAFEEWPALEI